MGKGIGKELIILLLFFGLIWVAVSYFSEDETEPIELIPDDLLEDLGELMLDDVNRTDGIELIANDSFQLESWSEILERIDFENTGCRAIYITENSQVNAFTLPGNNILIYSGLIEFVDSGEELASVVAHEIGHIEYNHVEELIAERMAIATLILVLSGDGGGGLLLDLSDALFTAAFSRDNEREADKFGLEILEKGGLPADSMLRFFEKLEEEHEDMPELLSAFSSHPLTKDRIEFIEDYTKKLYVKRPLELDWESFQQEMLDLSGHRD